MDMNWLSTTIWKVRQIVKITMMNNLKYIFYGTGPLAESAIYALYKAGLVPMAIITKPDAPIGRDQIITPPMIKTWALSKGIKVLQPTRLSPSIGEVAGVSDELKKEFEGFFITYKTNAECG